MTSRVAAALVGGYAMAYGFTAFLSLALPLGRVDRVAFATLFAFAAWCAAAIYVFAARSAWRAWMAPLGLGLALWGITLLFPEAAARP
ncbi:DUF3649 domain-containing protein [Arenimonas sp.]|uniref:DUF3649 domain-containing protein n=1 Tax=Arenimonas sp. TaxID=1872635 RepID=UPI0035ADD33A